MKEKFEKQVSETIWFSYREDFPSIMPEGYSKKHYTCDRGWGCMLRCGQMMMAEGIKRHYETQGKLSEDIKRENLLTIISLFSDFMKEGIVSPFSIQQMCPLAYSEYKSKPGEWYRASTVMMVLEQLHEKYGKRRVQNFRVCVLKEGTIYEDQIFKKAMEEDIEANENINEVSVENDENKNDEVKKDIDVEIARSLVDQPIIEEVKNNEDDYQEPQAQKKEEEEEKLQEDKAENKQWKNGVLLFIATKTGLDEHNKLYLPSILRLLRFPQSIGILGGRDTKGYYFLGFQGGSLLYLDPHYVQKAYYNFGDMEGKFDTHFAEKPFHISIYEVDTSIGFGFYIKDARDYDLFKRCIMKGIDEDSNFLLGFQEKTPSLEFKAGDVIEVDSMVFDEGYDIIS